jgi:tetratricopeptide (TPR) repeat protein
MTTAIIIVILIVILSIGLFFLIKKLSHVSDIEPEIYQQEGAITEFNSIPREVEELVDYNNYKSKPKAQFDVFISKIYIFYNQQMQNLNQIRLNYKQNQIEKIKAKEKDIQAAIQKDLEVQELESKEKKEHIVDKIDTTYFEVEHIVQTSGKENAVDSNSKKLKDEISPDTKATDFVEQLLSEVDAVSDSGSDDISDTYYYEYMEKRYIDRIVSNSKDIESYKKLGDLYVDMRNYKDALEAFQYILKLKPNDTLASRRVKDISNRLQN